MDIRYSGNPEDVKRYTTEELRKEFLITGLYKADEVVAVYSHVDRMVTFGCMPVHETVPLDKGIDCWHNFGTHYVLERREIGIFNIGSGAGKITVDGQVYALGYKDCLYITKGAKEVLFSSDDPEKPAKFSSAFTQALVHRMRAMHQAIMVGTRTVLLDNPTLTTRMWDGPNPLRVTIDRNNVLPDSVCLKDGSAPTVIYNNGDLKQILDDLYTRGIQSLLVEGGAQLLQHFIDAGLWDEARVEIAPMTLERGVRVPKIEKADLVGKSILDGRKILNYKREM